MGDTKNLSGNEAAEKIQELAKEIDTCMFCTYRSGKLVSRPMGTPKVDDDGTLWFLTSKETSKIAEIKKNDQVELLYAQGHAKFLSIQGTATLSTSKSDIKELFSPMAKIWLTEGVDDPRAIVIKVAVNEGYYWDTKHGRMVEMAILAAALVSGKTMDDGIEGKLK